MADPSVTEEATVAVETSEDTTVPTEYKFPLNKADYYANTMRMSKARLYDKLTSEYEEKFTAEEADYAIANLKIK